MAGLGGARWESGVLLLLMAVSVLDLLHGAQAQPQVPCYFIFGDSLIDNGNNNEMATIARANYPPYGIDYPRGVTGRFTNGRNVVDFIAEQLGFTNEIPPYNSVRGQELLTGANFASGGAGIRDETGMQLGGRISMNGQVLSYQSAVQRLVTILGDKESAANYLSQCIFTVAMGSNDYLNNYFMPAFYTSSRQYTPEQYADLLIAEFSVQLRELYKCGARKVALIGVGPVGCSPTELAMYSANGATCIERINDAIQIFNSRTRDLVDEFNRELPGSRFTFINGYHIFSDIYQHASSYGFTVINRGCCGVGRNNGQVTCLPFQTPCANRDQHIFWDAFHPTQAFSNYFARRCYRAQSSEDAYPEDISSLAQR